MQRKYDEIDLKKRHTFFFFFYIKRVLAKGKKIKYKKKSRLSPDPVKKIVGEKKMWIFNSIQIDGKANKHKNRHKETKTEAEESNKQTD